VEGVRLVSRPLAVFVILLFLRQLLMVRGTPWCMCIHVRCKMASVHVHGHAEAADDDDIASIIG